MGRKRVWGTTGTLRAALLAVLAFLLAGTLDTVVAAEPPEPGPVKPCDRWVSPGGNDANPGTQAAPYRSIAKLATSLAAGQTGCLGTAGGVSFSESADPDTYLASSNGTAASPITIRSFDPDNRAVLNVRLRLGENADNIVFRDLHFNGSPSPDRSWMILLDGADNITFYNSELNWARGHCILVGGNGASGSDDFLIERTRVHGCGMGLAPNGMGTAGVHGVYLETTDNAVVRNNWIYGNVNRGIQLYADSDGASVHHNVFDGNGSNLNISGELNVNPVKRSENNVFRDNLVTNATIRAQEDTPDYYPGPPHWPWGDVSQVHAADLDAVVRSRNVEPTYGNAVRDNCIHTDSVRAPYRFSGWGYREYGNLYQDPGYTDRPAGDFTLLPGSPCAGKGPQDPVPQLPETTIGSGPSGSTTAPGATFTFASPQSGVTFECRLDEDDWEECASPRSYNALAPGPHTFEVRALNAAGPDPTPASRSWTVVDGTTFDPADPAGPGPVAACDRWADPGGDDSAAGTAANPYRTLARLIDRLGAGQTGCLGRSGGARFSESAGAGTVVTTSRGTTAKPITIRSTSPEYPARVTARLHLGEGADNIVFRNIEFQDSTVPAGEAMIRLDGADNVTFFASGFSFARGHCLEVGGTTASSGSEDFLLDRSRVSGCGAAADVSGKPGFHGVFLRTTARAVIRDSWITGNINRGIQIYADSDDAYIHNNVLDGNGSALNISSESDEGLLSEGNVARRNLITNSTLPALTDPGWSPADIAQIYTYGFPGPAREPNQGDTYGNVIADNCIYPGEAGQVFHGWGFAEFDNRFEKPSYRDPDGGDFNLQPGSPCAGDGPVAAPALPPGFPDTVIESGPSGQTTSRQATFRFFSPQSTVTGFLCALDGAAPVECSSPHTYTGLALGAHRITVQAVSPAGSDPSPALRSWTVIAATTGTPPVPGRGNGKARCRNARQALKKAKKRLKKARRRAARARGATRKRRARKKVRKARKQVRQSRKRVKRVC